MRRPARVPTGPKHVSVKLERRMMIRGIRAAGQQLAREAHRRRQEGKPMTQLEWTEAREQIIVRARALFEQRTAAARGLDPVVLDDVTD